MQIILWVYINEDYSDRKQFINIIYNSTRIFRENSSSDSDFLFRSVPGDGLKSYVVTSTQTKVIRDNFNKYVDNHQKDIAILSSVIYWQKRTIDFQALHTAFLLNSISEEDFEQEAEKFAIRQHRVNPETIAFFIDRLDNLLEIDFDTSDYADYFKCTPKNVLEGLRLLLKESHTNKQPLVTDIQARHPEIVQIINPIYNTDSDN